MYLFIRAFHSLLLFFFINYFLLGCSGSLTQKVFAQSASLNLLTAEPWSSADLLFKKDQKWLGGDGAGSIDLGDNRVLWLFGDSIIAKGEIPRRDEAVMIRNSIAIQSGYNPSLASIRFYWKIRNKRPESFFPEDNDKWFWPGQGIKIHKILLIFLLKIRSSNNEFGFEAIGWKAVTILNSDEDPNKWVLNWLNTPENEYGVIFGSGSILLVNHFVYAFGSDESRDHGIYLIRWPVNHVIQENLVSPEWWAGKEKGWVKQQNLTGKPQPVFSEGQTEFTVHFEPLLGKFLEIQTAGFGSADIAFRIGESVTGPWSDLQRFYRPDEYFCKDVLIYAGKAHPELVGADIVLTYATNSTHFSQLIGDTSLYFPRFLKVNLKLSPE